MIEPVAAGMPAAAGKQGGGRGRDCGRAAITAAVPGAPVLPAAPIADPHIDSGAAARGVKPRNPAEPHRRGPRRKAAAARREQAY